MAAMDGASQSFWAIELTPGKEFATHTEFDIHVTQAVLPAAAKDTSRTVVNITYPQVDALGGEKKATFAIASLRLDRSDSQPLDVVIDAGTEVTFSVVGKNPVHLIGYLLFDNNGPDDFDDEIDFDEDDEEDEDEDEDEAEEEIAAALQNAAGKRKAPQATGNGAPQAKKIKQDANKEQQQKPQQPKQQDKPKQQQDKPKQQQDKPQQQQKPQQQKPQEQKPQEQKPQEQKPQEQKSQDQKPQEQQGQQQGKRKGKKNQKKAPASAETTPTKPEEPSTPTTPTTPKSAEGKPKNQTPGQKGESRSFTHRGVQITVLQEGGGAIATVGRQVSVKYVGKLANEKVFDASTKAPFSFKLGARKVIDGWDIGVEGMKEGEKRRLVIPPHLAYGSQKNGPIPANATLTFDVELVKA